MSLLYINACISPNNAPRTKRLADAFLDAYAATHPNEIIDQVRLETDGLLPLDRAALLRREDAARNGQTDGPAFSKARQFAAADKIVVAAPYWELSFPSALKVYIENISVNGISFGYDAEGRCVGLCRAERMLYLCCAGGPVGERNFGEKYLKAIADEYGIQKFDAITAEMQDVVGGDGEQRLANAMEQAQKLANNF